jgi:hypothetical protein
MQKRWFLKAGLLAAGLLAACDEGASTNPDLPGTAPHLVSLDQGIVGFDFYGNRSFQADTIRAGDSAAVSVHGWGSGASFEWFRDGIRMENVAEPGLPGGNGEFSPFLKLGVAAKSDSGAVIKCVVRNASGADSLETVLRVVMPAWKSGTLFLVLPGGSSFLGPFADLDTTQYGETSLRNVYGSEALSFQARLDLVVGRIGSAQAGRNFLASPRLAKRMGLSYVSSLDSSSLAATKMVLTRADVSTQETARALYESGKQEDSVGIDGIGRFRGDGDAKIILKTTGGRYMVLPRATNTELSEQANYYFSLVRVGHRYF